MWLSTEFSGVLGQTINFRRGILLKIVFPKLCTWPTSKFFPGIKAVFIHDFFLLQYKLVTNIFSSYKRSSFVKRSQLNGTKLHLKIETYSSFYPFRLIFYSFAFCTFILLFPSINVIIESNWGSKLCTCFFFFVCVFLSANSSYYTL